MQRWYDHFPTDQILVLCSEEYYERPAHELARAAQFVGIDPQLVAGGAGDTVRNAAAGEPVDDVTAGRLRERFAPHNAALVALTGRRFPWAGQSSTDNASTSPDTAPDTPTGV